MTSSRQKTITSLGDLSAKLLAADLGNKETFAQVGLIIEEVLSKAAKLPDDVLTPLELALETLQGIYGDSVADASTAMDAIASIVAAVGQRLSSDGEPEEMAALQKATENLQAILSSDSEPEAVADEVQTLDAPSVEQSVEPVEETGKTEDNGKKDLASTLSE